ncbi:hypothetical protein WG66_016655 [Moniliophthora roreri]|nr:hypothetical protein WG66_016655 [Moniliophthora roreri]
MSTATPDTHSALRRLRQVYVEIPPSPLHTNSSSRTNSVPANMPLSPTRSNMPLNAPPQKRKLSNAAQPVHKKQKTDGFGTHKENSSNSMVNEQSTSSKPEPTAYYCHQCNKKRDVPDILFCTASQDNPKGKGPRCRAKYCRNCLRNRYNEDIDANKLAAPTPRDGVRDEAPYSYRRARCRDMCDCTRCRKAKGLEPLRQPGQNKSAGLMGQDRKQKASEGGQAASTSKLVHAKDGSASTKPNVKKPSAKRLPSVKWTKLPINLSLDEAEARIQIREFVLRFENTVGRSIARSHIEDLERIGRIAGEDDMPCTWVTEACVKAIIVGLLGTLADEEDSSAATVIKTAIKQIRSAGVNLNKIWVALAALREALDFPDDTQSTHSESSESSEDRIIITFPDPLPPPDGVTASYSTRSSRASAAITSADISIISSMQLIPVINGLIEIVIESHTIREELDEGVTRGKEITKDVRESMKKENEKWERTKKDIEANADPEVSVVKLKEARQSQKESLQGLENPLKVVMSAFMPRFGPLGTDHGGRVYYALSPGVRDREFAMNQLVGASKKSKGRKPIRRAKSLEERTSFQEWSWFLAVWGKKPSEVDSSGTEPRWWVFWEPEEIRRLAIWISGTNDWDVKIESGDPSITASHSRLKSLVKNLQEYAATLEWRCKGEEAVL